MSDLPEGLELILEKNIYQRISKEGVSLAFERLGVQVTETVLNFYLTYEGPFWEETLGYLLLDIIDDNPNIESHTLGCREEHGFPVNYLVISELSAGAVLVLDSSTDKVYEVDFEGGNELLVKGGLQETWSTFYEFLKEYFNC